VAFKFHGTKFYLGSNIFKDQVFVSDSGFVISEEEFLLAETQETVLLEGQLALPAFRDGHAHPLFAGREAQGLSITDCKSQGEIQIALRDFRSSNPNGIWIDGAVYDRSLDVAFNRHTLDHAVADIPVVLHGDDHHTLWVNTKALEVAGLFGSNTSNIHTPGVDVDRDNIPTGILREWPAMRLILELEPERTLEQDIECLVLADRKLAAAGIVECYDAWIDPGMAETFIAASNAGKISLDYKLCFRADPNTFLKDLPYIKSMREQVNQRPNLDGNAIKFFVDGVFGSATAMVSTPYESDGSHGVPVWNEEKLREAIKLANAENFQVHIHAIGDAATSLALEILEEITLKSMAYRPVIIHAELTNDYIIKRMKALNAIACVQPYWAQYNGMLQSCIHHLGHERIQSLYAFKDMMVEDVTVVFSSDWPVSNHEPLKGIGVSVNRRETHEQSPHNPNQAVSAEQALSAYTTSVVAMREISNTETLDHGSSFDIVLLDQNVFEIPSLEIGKTKVLATFKQGNRIF
jgi:predicted amidohydrolase YtcJ